MVDRNFTYDQKLLDEINMLEARFGPDWFHKLGYKEEDGYKNPS